MTQGIRSFEIFIFSLILLWLSFEALPLGAQPPSPSQAPPPASTPAGLPAPVVSTPAGLPAPVISTPAGQPAPPALAPAGQPAPPGQSAPDQSPAVQSQPPTPPTGLETTSPDRSRRGRTASIQGLSAAKRGEVSFNFDDADVYSVIQTIFGGVLQVNYIIDPKVKGRVNFRSVAPVAKEDVLPLMEVILRLNGIGVVEEGGLYRIIPIADMPREPAPVKIGREAEKVSLQGLGLLQVVPMNYIPSTEMVKVLTPFLSTNAVIVDVPKINYLILVDTDANVKRLLQLVEIFDSEKLKRIKPEVFVYPVQNGKAKDLAGLLQQIYLGSKAPPRPTTSSTPSTPARPGTPAPTPTPAPTQPTPTTIGAAMTGDALVSDITRIFSDEITNSLVILATPEDYALILETLKKLDQVPRQVMIEMLIVEIKLSDELKFGLEWSLKSQADKGFIDIRGAFSSSTIPSSTPGTVIPPAGFTFLGLDPTGLIQAKLNTLATQNKSNVLASPHIMAADNREAKIQIGSQVPIVTDVQSTTVTTQTVQYKDTGVILKIKPSINDSGLVSLEINQEVSTFTFQQIGTNTFPVFDKREASTYMVAQDGQTIVMGGLIQEQTGKSRAGLPFLSRIPILGYLFGFTDDTFSRTEIILLLTPRVVKNQKEADKLTEMHIHRLDKSFESHVKKDRITIPKEQ